MNIIFYKNSPVLLFACRKRQLIPKLTIKIRNIIEMLLLSFEHKKIIRIFVSIANISQTFNPY